MISYPAAFSNLVNDLIPDAPDYVKEILSIATIDWGWSATVGYVAQITGLSESQAGLLMSSDAMEAALKCLLQVFHGKLDRLCLSFGAGKRQHTFNVHDLRLFFD